MFCVNLDFHALSRPVCHRVHHCPELTGPASQAPREQRGSTSVSCLQQLLSWAWTESTASLPLAFPENTTSKGPHPDFKKSLRPGASPPPPRGQHTVPILLLEVSLPIKAAFEEAIDSTGHPFTSGGGPKDRGEKALASLNPTWVQISALPYTTCEPSAPFLPSQSVPV